MPILTIQVDEQVQTEVTAVLNAQGLTISDVVQMTLKQIAAEKRLPPFLTLPPDGSEKQSVALPSGDDLTELTGFGLWADRQDMDNPTEWVQNLGRGRYRDF
jgi:addiction module RelB/DinJ family antitoxin